MSDLEVAVHGTAPHRPRPPARCWHHVHFGRWRPGKHPGKRLVGPERASRCCRAPISRSCSTGTRTRKPGHAGPSTGTYGYSCSHAPGAVRPPPAGLSRQSADFQALVARQAYLEIYDCLQDTACNAPAAYLELLSRASRLPCAGQPQPLRCCSAVPACRPCRRAASREQHLSCGHRDRQPNRDFLQVYFLAGDALPELPSRTRVRPVPTTTLTTECARTSPVFTRRAQALGPAHALSMSRAPPASSGMKPSIVDDVGAQLNESLNNVETLVVHANNRHQLAAERAGRPALHQGVRTPSRTTCSQIQPYPGGTDLPGSDAQISCCCGEMCRDDLLVEIEALYQA